MLDTRLPHLPDDWSVWAFSDAHGVASGLVAALQQAGLVDADARWMAPPRTALVGCGDYIDRGGDVPGLLALLGRLEAEAAAAGGAVILARGNHEVMPLMARDQPEWLGTWLEFGGDATVRAFDCGEPDPGRGMELLDSMERSVPWLFAWMGSLPQAVRWRDVLFVHGGLALAHGLDDLGITTDEHLWIRSGFFETPWDSGGFDAYRSAGIDRVVFGHTPQPSGPTFYHDGHSLCIDTNAVGDPRVPDDGVQELTLLGLADSGTFDDMRLIRIPTADAPDRMRR